MMAKVCMVGAAAFVTVCITGALLPKRQELPTQRRRKAFTRALQKHKPLTSGRLAPRTLRTTEFRDALDRQVGPYTIKPMHASS